jgi:peptide/nickel transport system substrate-binding protein
MSRRLSLKRPLVLLSTTLLLSGAVAGCGGGGSSTNTSGPKVLTIATERPPNEPIGLLTRLGGSKAYTDLAGDVLIVQDPKDGSLHGQLATSWKQTSPNDWEFVLRQGVKFHNGEPFNAAAAAWNIQKETEPDSPARVVRYAKGLTATAKDDYTLEVHCPKACPILDRIAPQLQFTAPKWAQEHPDEAANTPMGTGPFYLAERKEGQYLLYKAFKDYWGDTGYFDEVKIVWRDETSVRASMVAANEAQLTEGIDPQNMKVVPKTFAPKSVDYAWIRLRDRDASGKLDPIWGDQRFRQALAYALDCDAMVKTLLNNASECSPVPFNPASVGYSADEQRYKYDPQKARQLLDEVLGPGKKLDGVKIYAETGDIPKLWAETIMSYWADVGVNATFQFVDGERREKLHSPGVKGTPPDVYIQRSHTNDLYDATVSLAYIDGCNEPRSYSVCDQVFSQKLKDAGSAGGEERAQLLQQLVKQYYIEGAHQITLWNSPAIYGAVKNLEWKDPQVGWLRPDLMKLTG